MGVGYLFTAQVVTTGSLSAGSRHRRAAERTYLTSEVRGRSLEDLMPKGSGQEELLHVRGQAQRPRVPGCDGAGTADWSYPTSEALAAARRSNPTPRSGGCTAQEGLEEPSPFEGQERRR